MGSLSFGYWLIVLVIVLVLFGTKKLRNIGGDLGSAIKSFRKGLNDGEDKPELKADPPAVASSAGERDKERADR